ncbi:MAG: hypothetical protein KJ941_04975 [Bacteroidetes bacterium]|nr:hypothetical protein [Bacteroidota bacterium]
MWKLSVLLFFLIFVACKKEPFQWKSDYSVPIITDELGIEDLIRDSIFTQDAFGNYSLEINRELYKLGLNSFVGIPDTSTFSEFKSNFTVNIPPGFTFINQVEEDELMMGEVELERVKIQTGKFHVRLENPFETKVIFKLTLPDVKINGVNFVALATAPPGSLSNPSISDFTFAINQADISLKGTSGNKVNTIQSMVEVTSDPAGPTVQATSQHVTRVTSSFKEMVLDYAQGYFGQQKLKDTLELKVDLFKKVESGMLDFSNAELNLELKNSAKVIGKINVHSIEGKNKNGNIVQLQNSNLNVNRNINTAVGSYGNYTPSKLNYDFNSQNSNLEQFLENLISDLKVIYTYELNPYGNISGSFDEAFGNEIFTINANFKMPLNIGIDELVVGDTVALNFGDIKERMEKIENLDFLFTGSNSFLLDGTMSFYFLDDKNDVLIEKIKSLKIPSANTGNNNLSGVKESSINSKISFNAQEVKALMNAEKVVIKVKLNTPNENGNQNVPMIFNNQQKIKIKGVINGIYKNEIK